MDTILLIILICFFVSLFKSFSLVSKGIVFLVCETKFNNDLKLETLVNEKMMTSINNVYAVGDCKNIMGSVVGYYEGLLCGYGIIDEMKNIKLITHQSDLRISNKMYRKKPKCICIYKSTKKFNGTRKLSFENYKT